MLSHYLKNALSDLRDIINITKSGIEDTLTTPNYSSGIKKKYKYAKI